MKTFRKFVEEFTLSRKYVAVQYDEESQKKLRDWAELNGFDLSVNYNGEPQDPKEFDFHTTIFYSTNEVNMNNKSDRIDPTEVTITGIKFLGEEEDIPVLTVSLSGGIKNLRKYYENLGLKDQWPSYQPHISLSYAKNKLDVNKIELPNFQPIFDKIVVKEIEE
jgi:2'-5' RNA ligase